jgi:predicted nucleic acid-binding protein
VKLYTLDASAWLRLFLHDGPMPALLDSTAACVQRGDAGLVAPELILVETAHVLQRKCRSGFLRADEVRELWVDMRRTPLDLLAVSEHIDTAMDLAAEHGLSTYDALYLAVALRTGSTLLTADDQLQRIAAKLGLA